MTEELKALTQWDIPDNITPGGDMPLSLQSVVMSAGTTLIFIDLIWMGIFIYDSSY